MSDIAIKVQGLGKKYLLRHQEQGRSRYKSLRDVLTDKAKSLLQVPGGQRKAKATREARHTLGKKQRLAIKAVPEPAPETATGFYISQNNRPRPFQFVETVSSNFLQFVDRSKTI